MAERVGRRETLRSPVKTSCDRRGREVTCTPGISCSINGFIVPAPIRQRLLASALVEQVISKDMTAIEIGGELHLVDGDEGEIEIARHGFRRADPVARLARLESSPRQ